MVTIGGRQVWNSAGMRLSPGVWTRCGKGSTPRLIISQSIDNTVMGFRPPAQPVEGRKSKIPTLPPGAVLSAMDGRAGYMLVRSEVTESLTAVCYRTSMYRAPSRSAVGRWARWETKLDHRPRCLRRAPALLIAPPGEDARHADSPQFHEHVGARWRIGMPGTSEQRALEERNGNIGGEE